MTSEEYQRRANRLKASIISEGAEISWADREQAAMDLLHIAMEQKDAQMVGFAYYYLGEYYYLKNDLKQCMSCMYSAIDPLKYSEQWELVVKSYNILAALSMGSGNTTYAIDHLVSGLEYCEKIRRPELMAMIHMNIGSLFLQTAEPATALSYAQKAMEVFESRKDDPEMALNLASCYLLLTKCNLLLMDRKVETPAGADSQTPEERDWHLAEALKCRKKLEELEITREQVFKIPMIILDIRITDRMGSDLLFEKHLASMMKRLDEEYPVMTVIDELVDLSQLLLARRRGQELDLLLQVLEKRTKSMNVTYVTIRVLRMRLDFYEVFRGDTGAYHKALEMYYAMVKRQEEESKYLNNIMMNQRILMSRLTKENRELLQRSEEDALTGLPNRFKLNDYSEKSFEYAYHERKGLGMEILDVDYFKEFNDTYGHAAGDHCLMVVADVLKRCVEPGKVFAARYGGDEFMIIYRDMTKEEVLATANRIKDDLESQALLHKGSKVNPYVTLSQGIYYGTPIPGNKVWDFLHAADEALYEVKRKTRNGIHMDDRVIEPVRE